MARDEWLSPAQVAQLLDIDISTVFRWIRRPVRNRKLPSQLWGGRRRIRRADLDEFLRAGGLPADRDAVDGTSTSTPDGSNADSAGRELDRILGRDMPD